MTKLRKCLVWYIMLTKRLFHQWTFIALLCMIPIIIPLTNIAMSHDSGIVRVVLCNENGDSSAERIIDSLIEEESIILFTKVNSPTEAKNTVVSHKADAAWIFSSNFTENMNDYFANKTTEPFIEIIERENSIPLRISREKLFGTIYSDVSYSIYKNFVYTELVNETQVPEHEVQQYYNSLTRNRDILQLEKLNSQIAVTQDITYLNAPIRGILVLIIVLCTLAAALYYLQDQAKGRFDWMPAGQRILPAFGSCLSAATLATIAVFAAIQISGISTGIANELLPTLLYIFSTTGFCLIFCMCFRSAGKLGAIIPGIMIVMLILSPIFFNLKVLQPIRLALPTYYYLQSVYNPHYNIYAVVYCIITYAVALVLNYLLSKSTNKKSIL